MKARTHPTGDGRTRVWLAHGRPLTVCLLTTTPEHAARIAAAVNAPAPVNSAAVAAAISDPFRLEMRLARRSRCSCETTPTMTEGPAADCPRHGDPAVLGYTPEAQRHD